MWKSFNKPKDNEQGIIKTETIIETTTVAFSLDILNASRNEAIEASIILIEEVKAAKNNNTKKITAKILPINGSFSKT